MSKLLIDQIKELLKHIETNPDALNKFEKNSYFQALKKAKIIDFKTKQTLADEGEPLLPSPAKGKLTGIDNKKEISIVKPKEKKSDVKIEVLKDLTGKSPYKEGTPGWHAWLDINQVSNPKQGQVVLINDLSSYSSLDEKHHLGELSHLINDGYVKVHSDDPQKFIKKTEDYYRNLVKNELAKAKIIDFKTKQTLADEGEPLLPSPAKGKLTGIEGGKVNEPPKKPNQEDRSLAARSEKLETQKHLLESEDSKVHEILAQYSDHPEIQAKLLESKNPRVHQNLAYYSQHPEIQYKLLERKDPKVHRNLAINSQNSKIQSKLLEGDDIEVHRNLANSSTLPEIQAKLLNSNDIEVHRNLMDRDIDPKIVNAAYKKFIQLQQKTNKSETYYKGLVESTLEKAKKSKKPFHGYNPKKHAKTGGLNDKYRKKVNRETGSNLKRPSKDKSNSRHKSFCARMKGVKGPTSKEGKLTPKGAALKRWNCSKNEHSDESLCKKSRCWAGYEPTPGKKPYSKGSCRPIKKNDYFSSLIKKTLKHD